MDVGVIFIGVLLLAGCTSNEDPADPSTPSLPNTLTFQTPLRLPSAHVSAEPNVIVGSDGIYVIGVGSLVKNPNVEESQAPLWVSRDNGVTYAALKTVEGGDPNSTYCSCDADVAQGPDGVVYVTDFWVTRYTGPALPDDPTGLFGTPTGFVVQASTDGGRTFGAGNFLVQTDVRGNDRQYLTAGDTAGELFLTYARGADLGTADRDSPDNGLFILRSTDAGRTFGAPIRAWTPPDDGTRFAFIAKHRIDADGTVFFPYVEYRASDPWNGTATGFVAVSKDEGATFTPRKIADIQNGVGGLWPMQAALDGAGRIYATYMERGPSGIGSRLYLAWSSDEGATFSKPIAVTPETQTAVLPWIDVSSGGRVAIGYYGAEGRHYAFDAPDETKWSAYAVIVDNATGTPDITPPIPASPWPVKVGRFCPMGAACPRDRELLDYPGIAITRDGGWVHLVFASSILDAGAGPQAAAGSTRGTVTGGHDTAAFLYASRLQLR